MATFERAQAEAASAAQRLAQMRREHARLRRVVEETADAAARTAFEQKMQDLQRQMAEHGHPPPDPQMRLGEARHALDTERARFDELEAALERLDRELEPPVR
jgi:small-conductance mechanosensitive channel